MAASDGARDGARDGAPPDPSPADAPADRPPGDAPFAPARPLARRGPVVVLTGASSGIGRAAALAFAGQGARLVLTARDADALEPVAEACRRSGARALAVAADVTDAEALRRLAATAVERFGGIDLWINNVGVGAVGRFDETPMAVHRRIVETNLIGQMNGAHAVLPHFRERGRGTLVHMVSVGGWAPAPYATAYSASKFALRGFAEALRAELAHAPGIRVCEVYPTFVDTPGLAHSANYTGRRIEPSPPLLDPREVAEVLVSLWRRPRDVVSIGSVALPARLAHAVAPQLTARLTRRLFDIALRRADPGPSGNGNVFEPARPYAIDGGYRMAAVSARQRGAGVAVAGTALALGALGLAWWAVRRQREREARA